MKNLMKNDDFSGILKNLIQSNDIVLEFSSGFPLKVLRCAFKWFLSNTIKLIDFDANIQTICG